MLQRIILTAVASLALTATASAQQPVDQQKTEQQQDDHGQKAMQAIHDELTAKGFKDVRVMPGSFVVSGTDQQGKPVVMLIGPDAMTVLTPADGDAVLPPQQAQQKDPKLQNWE